MIAAFLTIVGLVIAFFDKEHLFKKPVTVKKVLILLLLGVSAIISFINDISNDRKGEKASATIDSLTSRSATLNEQVFLLRKENKDAQKGYSDSIVSYHNYTTELLARYGLKVDTLADAVKKFDTSVKKESLPTLTILYKPEFERLNNEKIITYQVSSLNADANLISYQYIIVKKSPGLTPEDLILIDKPIYQPGVLNSTYIIPNGASARMIFFIDREKTEVKLTDEFVLVIEYTYKSLTNKSRPKMKKMFLIKYSTDNVSEISNDFFKFVETHIEKAPR